MIIDVDNPKNQSEFERCSWHLAWETVRKQDSSFGFYSWLVLESVNQSHPWANYSRNTFEKPDQYRQAWH